MILFRFFILVSLLIYISFFSSISEAQSAKVTAKIGNINIVDGNNLGWTTVLSNSLKVANQKDLIIGVSMECGLYTQTLVRSKGGTKDTSSASAHVAVRVVIDGKEARPGAVTFCKRDQELSVKLGGILDECTDSNGDGSISLDECELIEEEIELVLRTMNANAFNFILEDLGSGSHTIEVQARIESSDSSQAGSASSAASIGNGSMTVEEVRMVKGEDIFF